MVKITVFYRASTCDTVILKIYVCCVFCLTANTGYTWYSFCTLCGKAKLIMFRNKKGRCDLRIGDFISSGWTTIKAGETQKVLINSAAAFKDKRRVRTDESTLFRFIAATGSNTGEQTVVGGKSLWCLVSFSPGVCVCVIKAKGAYDSRSYRRGILSAAGFNKSVCGLILST